MICQAQSSAVAPYLGKDCRYEKLLPPVFVGHEVYRRAAYGSNHPLAIPRVESVMDVCKVLGWLGQDSWRESPRASEAQLAWFHTRDYLDAMRVATRSGKVDMQTRQRFALGTMENPLFPGLYERATTSVGGSILAAELALEGRIAYHPAGGTHHGRPDRASGFCYFNDPVFAVLTLIRNGVERILYVDLDAHHGDAVQDAFAEEAKVWTVSLHEQGRWPHTGAAEDTGGGRACNLPVPAGFNDSELLRVLEDVILPLGSSVQPQAVVVVCGADALAGDPLSSMMLSNMALWSATKRVVELAPAAVVLGGGGYNPWTLCRYWSGLWGSLAGHAIPVRLPQEAQAILARLRCDLIDDEDVLPEWLTTLADETKAGTVRPEIASLCEAALRRAQPQSWQPRPVTGMGAAAAAKH